MKVCANCGLHMVRFELELQEDAADKVEGLHDLNTVSGFVHALVLVLSLATLGLAHFAPVCSTVAWPLSLTRPLKWSEHNKLESTASIHWQAVEVQVAQLQVAHSTQTL